MGLSALVIFLIINQNIIEGLSAIYGQIISQETVMRKTFSFLAAVSFLLASAAQVNAGALSELSVQAGVKVSAPAKASVPAVSAPAVKVSAPKPAEKEQQAEWLVMVYIAGVNNLGLFGAASNNVNQMEKGLYEAGAAASSVKMVVEYGELASDGLGTLQIADGTKTLLVQPDNDFDNVNSKVIGISKNADTGNVRTLENFVRRVKSRFPAKKTALIIWNHGGGIVGIASDDIHGSMMNLKNLSATLKKLKGQFGKFDVLATDACLMQMASIAYEFKDYADVIIGSEQPIPGAGYPYYGMVRALAESGSSMSAKDFGAMLVEGYGYQYSGKSDTSLSAIDVSKLPVFKNKLNKWIGLLSEPENFKIVSKAAVLKEVTRMNSLDSSRDLVHMIQVVNRQTGVSLAAKAAGDDLQNYIKQVLIIRNYSSEPDNYGLAIYLPDLTYEANPYETLKFSADTDWSIFIRKILQSRLDNGW